MEKIKSDILIAIFLISGISITLTTTILEVYPQNQIQEKTMTMNGSMMMDNMTMKDAMKMMMDNMTMKDAMKMMMMMMMMNQTEDNNDPSMMNKDNMPMK